MIIVDKEKQIVQIEDFTFTKEELEKLLVPSEDINDDDLHAEFQKGDCQCYLSINRSAAGNHYFGDYLSDLEVSKYSDSIFIYIWVPFKVYFNIIKYGTVDYLFEVVAGRVPE